MTEISRDMRESMFSQRYRPQRADELVLDEVVRQNIIAMASAPEKRQSLLLAGPPGIGKTTVAKLLTNAWNAEYLFLNFSGEDRGIDAVRTKVSQFGSTVSLDGGPKVIIGDEADKLTPDAQDALRSTMEAISKTTTVIMTANYPGRLSDPLKSRMRLVDLTIQDVPAGMAQIARRAARVCELEGIEFDKEALKQVVRINFPDLRKTMDDLKWHGQNGRIDMATVERIRRASIEGFVELFKEKSFKKLVEWVYENVDNEQDFVAVLWSKTMEIWTPASAPVVAYHLNKAQVELTTVPDKKLALLAALGTIGREAHLNG